MKTMRIAHIQFASCSPRPWIITHGALAVSAASSHALTRAVPQEQRRAPRQCKDLRCDDLGLGTGGRPAQPDCRRQRCSMQNTTGPPHMAAAMAAGPTAIKNCGRHLRNGGGAPRCVPLRAPALRTGQRRPTRTSQVSRRDCARNRGSCLTHPAYNGARRARSARPRSQGSPRAAPRAHRPASAAPLPAQSACRWQAPHATAHARWRCARSCRRRHARISAISCGCASLPA